MEMIDNTPELALPSPVIAFMVAQATGVPPVQPNIAPSVTHLGPFSVRTADDFGEF